MLLKQICCDILHHIFLFCFSSLCKQMSFGKSPSVVRAALVICPLLTCTPSSPRGANRTSVTMEVPAEGLPLSASSPEDLQSPDLISSPLQSISSTPRIMYPKAPDQQLLASSSPSVSQWAPSTPTGTSQHKNKVNAAPPLTSCILTLWNMLSIIFIVQ